ncbi:hypothetical protein ATCC51561_360 [Campylobacter concisus ATCC 51561]|nr:hypothetical protein ATCC51561_360 [Campylobacter concisus ATCC 51561]
MKPNFSSQFLRVNGILKFANLLRQTYKCQTNFKICKKSL